MKSIRSLSIVMTATMLVSLTACQTAQIKDVADANEISGERSPANAVPPAVRKYIAQALKAAEGSGDNAVIALQKAAAHLPGGARLSAKVPTSIDEALAMDDASLNALISGLDNAYKTLFSGNKSLTASRNEAQKAMTERLAAYKATSSLKQSDVAAGDNAFGVGKKIQADEVNKTLETYLSKEFKEIGDAAAEVKNLQSNIKNFEIETGLPLFTKSDVEKFCNKDTIAGINTIKGLDKWIDYTALKAAEDIKAMRKAGKKVKPSCVVAVHSVGHQVANLGTSIEDGIARAEMLDGQCFNSLAGDFPTVRKGLTNVKSLDKVNAGEICTIK